MPNNEKLRERVEKEKNKTLTRKQFLTSGFGVLGHLEMSAGGMIFWKAANITPILILKDQLIPSLADRIFLKEGGGRGRSGFTLSYL